MASLDPNLRAYCATVRQKEIFDAVNRNTTLTDASIDLGIDVRNVQHAIRRIMGQAAQKGYAPGHWEEGTAPGYDMGKVTVQRGSEGQVERTWERQLPEKERAAVIIRECLESLSYKPAPVRKAPRKLNKDLLSLYTITDFHLGMYAWGDETGEDWDTEIASEVLVSAINEMAYKAPNSHTALLNIQGDFLHWDGLEAVTPQNKHVLDADTRFARMVELALDLTMFAIEILLRKHHTVRVIVCDGNHDEAGSAWLRKSMKKIYRRYKRVDIDDTEFPFYGYLHGNTMLGFHHGHKVKNKELPALFASEPRYREMWGNATYTYIHTGHYHFTEQDMSEYGGAIVERHPTLAARDAFAARGGYISRRGARVITYHVDDGEVDRSTVLPRR